MICLFLPSDSFIKLSLNRAEEADLKLIVVDAKNPVFSDVLKGLLDKNAILVINKSDLLKGDIDSEIKKLNHVLILLYLFYLND